MSNASADIRPEEPIEASSEAGFSLVEALVALFLFGAAAVGLAQLQGQSLRILQEAETRSLAGLMAQNVLVETMAGQTAPQVGIAQGEGRLAGRDWDWRRTVQLTEDRSVLQISVAVFLDGEDRPAAEVVAFSPTGGAQ